MSIAADPQRLAQASKVLTEACEGPRTTIPVMPLGGSVPTVAGLANQVAAEWEDALRARLVAVEKTSAGLAATARIVDESESSAIALIERIAREGDAL